MTCKNQKKISRQISIIKGEERFVFNYEEGREPELIDCFTDMADDGKTSFDHFDAAVLSYQLGRRFEIE